MSNTKFNKGKGTNLPNEKPTCGNSCKKHYCDCLKGTNNCFSCGKSDQKIRDCPILKSQDKGSGQAQSSCCSAAPKKNHFYVICSRVEQETFPDVVIGMLKDFSIDVYELLDIGVTFSFIDL